MRDHIQTKTAAVGPWRWAILPAVACLLVLSGGGGVASADTGLGFSSEFGSAGAGTGQFISPTGVAVDQSSGDVYVVDSLNARVEKFGTAGEFILMFGWEVNETTKGNICTEAEITGSGVKCQTGVADKEAAEAKPGQFGVGTLFGAPFFGPIGIAVDPTAPHHVYVTDSVNNRVQEFDSAGNHLGQVNGSEPSCPGPFSDPSGVAVDPSSGELYVADAGNNRIVKINPVTGVCDEPFDSEIAGTAGFASVSGIALDAAGNVYVVAGERVDKFNVAGKLQATEALDAGGNPASVAVNPATNDVYVGDASGPGYHFFQYGSTGTLLDEFGDTFYPSGFTPFVESSTGVGVSQGSGDVYASDHNRNDVVLFSATAALPSVSGVSAPSPGTTTASLQATIAPGDATNSYHFDYGLETTYANGSTTEATPNAGAAEALLTGLEPNAIYHYRLVTSNARGTTYGADQTLTTAEAVPSIDEESHESVTQTDATLSATINPNNLATSYQFKIGENTGYTTGTVPSPAGTLEDRFGDQSVHVDLNTAGITLAPNTEYHYKVIATNAAGPTVEGEDQTFTTPPPQPTATTGEASNVAATSATIAGTVNPGSTGPKSETRYFFEYSTETTPEGFFECAAPCIVVPSFPGGDAGQGTSDVLETVHLTGLQSLKAYHYRIAAYNGNGIVSAVFGKEKEFTSLPLAPGVTTEVPVSVGADTATVGGEIVAQKADTKYHIQYGTSEAFGANTPVADAGSGTTGRYVTTTLEGLQPATTYYYRFVASNSGGSEAGETDSFTTNTAGEPSSSAVPGGFSLTGTAPAGPTAAIFPNLTGFGPVPAPKTSTSKMATALTNSQKLGKALKACKKDKAKKKRQKCERDARSRYKAKKKK